MPAVGYEQLMHRNLSAVFSERDAAARARAMDELYAPDPLLYEPAAVVQGRQAISDTIARLLAELPPGFAFTPRRPRRRPP